MLKSTYGLDRVIVVTTNADQVNSGVLADMARADIYIVPLSHLPDVLKSKRSPRIAATS